MPKTPPPKKPKKHKLTAKTADKYRLYQLSVQEPDHEVEFFDRVYKENFHKTPQVLREDFCGTFAVCCEWVKAGPKREAVGVDLDPEPVDWGKANNLAPLEEKQQARVALRLDDVRKVAGPKADVLAAQNFSYFLFTTRDALRDYFKAARRNLGAKGVMVCDMMGGPECQIEDQEDTRRICAKGDRLGEHMKKGCFEYVWEQQRFDPITHGCRFAIHFRFDDGTAMTEAFSYQWRFWTLPEVRELLLEAGFDRVDVYWEGADEDTGEGDGNWEVTEHAPADPAWIAYVVGVKGA